MLPKINGVFRLSKDPEQRYTQSGSSIVSLSLVSSEKYKDKEDTCFIDAVVFGALGDKVVMTYLKKGSQINISGKLKQDSWTNNEGQKMSKHSVTIEGIELLGNKDKTQTGTNHEAPSQGQCRQPQHPTDQSHGNESSGKAGFHEIDMDSDLPF